MSTPKKYIIKWVGLNAGGSGNYLLNFIDNMAYWYRLSAKAKRYSRRQAQRVAAKWGPEHNRYVQVVEVSS